MNLYQLHVRRDAHTTTPVTVPEYEVPILQSIFGEENIHNVDGKRVDEVGLGEPVGEFKPSDDEFSRLSAKYGANEDGLLVEQVFGKKASKGLDNAIAAAGGEKKAAKRGKNADAAD